jgi:FtsZ-binding cell division protein ZapB
MNNPKVDLKDKVKTLVDKTLSLYQKEIGELQARINLLNRELDAERRKNTDLEKRVKENEEFLKELVAEQEKNLNKLAVVDSIRSEPIEVEIIEED